MQPPLFQGTVCQKLPADFRAKVGSFGKLIEKQPTQHKGSPHHIINMDEENSQATEARDYLT